jgi:D-inositol-3-phosphate glycosyltransferase
VYKGRVRPRASRAGPGRGFFRRPRGFIDDPRRGSAHVRGPLYVRGWALFPGSTVARVEVRLRGGPPQLARIGLERQDVAQYTDHPDAPISGWEHTFGVRELTGESSAARVDVTAHATDGRTLRLTPVAFRLLPAPAPRADAKDRAEELRRGSTRALGDVAVTARGPSPHLLAYTHTLALGGASLYLQELLLRLLDSDGFSCEVVTLAGGPLRDELEHRGVPVHVTDASPVSSMERYEGHLAELVAWAAPRGFDAVLVNTLSGFAGAELADRLGLPVAWAIHESYALPTFWTTAFPAGRVDPYVRERTARALRRADAVLFVAEATRRLFAGDAADERLLVLPPGVELGAIEIAKRTIARDAARARLGVPDDAQVVLGLGSFEPRKAQTMLAQAFGLVAGRHPRAHLLLVGQVAEPHREGYQSALRDYLRRARLEDRVSVEPVTSDPYAWHALADLLVCASDVESLPRVILEAMAFGTPVLSTSVFGAPEVIDDGRTGFLCGMRDVSVLADGLDRALAASPAERAAISAAAFEHVHAHHDPARYAGLVARLLRGVMADREALPGSWLEPRERELAPYSPGSHPGGRPFEPG